MWRHHGTEHRPASRAGLVGGAAAILVCVTAPAVPSARVPFAAVASRLPSGTQEAPRRLAVVDRLSGPEAVVFDARLDAYFVSNVNGAAGVKDGNGFISRIRADGSVDSLHFIQGGRGGVTLNSPMGSRIRGDTLWVLDVDVLRAFDARTAAPLVQIDFAPLGALFLNDVALGAVGDFYVTDTGVRVASGGKSVHTGPDRIYHVGRDRRPTVALETPALAAPDGIDWDPRGRRLVLAPFGGTAVQSWRRGQSAPTNVAPGKGRFDGIEVERDGRILVTSWNDSSVATLEGNRLVRQIGPLSMTPADVSLDARRGRAGIVSVEANRFELWTWP